MDGEKGEGLDLNLVEGSGAKVYIQPSEFCFPP